MSVTKNNALVREVRKHLAGGFEKKKSLPPPGSRLHKLGTIFSRTTGLIKSGVVPAEDIPSWYPVYKAFPPKYEPTFARPPLDVVVKDIYYPEDKLRAAIRRWDVMDLKSTDPNTTQKLVATFREQRREGQDEDALIKDILKNYTQERGQQDSRNTPKKGEKDLLDKLVQGAIDD